ncbi:phospholipase-like protein [Artemisia annua]|nr:phospholipase-like protein [Artemisia annua]
MFPHGASPYFFIHHQVLHPRAVAWSYNKMVFREKINKFLDDQLRVRRPPPRLRPDEVELLSEWWAHSKAFFDGNPLPPPVRQPQVNSLTDDEIPPAILQRFKMYDARLEQQQLELKKLAELNNQAIHQETSFVGDEPVGFSDFRVTQDTHGLPHTGHSPCGPPTDSFFGGHPVPTPPVTSTYPSPFPSTGYNANLTPMGFAAFATPMDSQAGPSFAPDMAFDMRDEIERPKRDCRPGKYQQYPWTQQGPTTILHKKRGTKQKKSTSNIPPFNLENEAVDEDAHEDDVTCVGTGYGNPIVIASVDPAKVRRYPYVSFEQFLIDPSQIYLDCHPVGWTAETTFFQQLVPDLYKSGTDPGVQNIGWLSDDQINCWMELLIRKRANNDIWTVSKTWTASCYSTDKGIEHMLSVNPSVRGMLDGSTRPYPSWDVVRYVAMPMNPFGDHWVTVIIDLHDSKLTVLDSMHSNERGEAIRHYIMKWTEVLNTCLDALGHFTRTRRPYYNFDYHYNDGFLVPQQGNSSDCGVISCWLIHEFVRNAWPPLEINNWDCVGFFSSIRHIMARMIYDRRCETTYMCGYE